MKIIITFLVFGISLGLNAQTKKEKKILDLYTKGKFEKSEKLAKKILSKDRLNSHALYILGFLDLREAQKSNSTATLKRYVLKSISKRNKINDKLLRSTLNDSLHRYIYLVLENENLKKKYNRSFTQLLAKEFEDTLSSYYSLNQFQSYPNSKKEINHFTSEDSLRNAMLHFAQKLEGTPYKWAGETPKNGFDCSGFTKYVFKSIGIELPHSAQKQSELSKQYKNLDNAKSGDMVFFGNFTDNAFYTQHAGIIYSKNGEDIEVIHCVSNGVNIEGEDSSWEYHWKDRVLFVIDVIAVKDEIEKKKQNEN
jgi:cell wall-associated NlpC family hydrolase